MNFRFLPPFFAAAPLFGNSASVLHEPLAGSDNHQQINHAEVSATRNTRSDEASDDERLPARDDTFYWALAQAHL